MKDTVVHKLYWDFEKEEHWLNTMAAKGLALTHFSWGTYRFEPSTPGQWTYRIELLPELPSQPASREYLAFMAETGARAVATYMGWVYFRRPTEDGPFELFSDLDSRIAHYKRVLVLFASVSAALIPSTVLSVMNVMRGEISLVFALPLLAMLMALIGVLGTQAFRQSQRVRELEAQKLLFE